MTVRHRIYQNNGVFFITFTCAQWTPLFSITNAYYAVYKWFDYLTKNRHHIVGYVIMPSHVHAVIAFSNSAQSINTIVGNGKRFMAYELVKQLQYQKRNDILERLAGWVNETDKKRNKKHEIFEPSFDHKECVSLKFMEQKVNYIHLNPCKAGLCVMPEDYLHSSARYYYTGRQGIYPVITFLELQDIDLNTL